MHRFKGRLKKSSPSSSEGRWRIIFRPSQEERSSYSIVNTLAFNFPEIKQVQILVEGEETPTLAGRLDLRRLLKPRIRFKSSEV